MWVLSVIFKVLGGYTEDCFFIWFDFCLIALTICVWLICCWAWIWCVWVGWLDWNLTCLFAIFDLKFCFGFVWGWLLGLVISVLCLLCFGGLLVYVYFWLFDLCLRFVFSWFYVRALVCLSYLFCLFVECFVYVVWVFGFVYEYVVT